MTVQMIVMNTAEAMRATGNVMISTATIKSTSWVWSYFTANVSGAVSANLQSSPQGFGAGVKANTLANTPAVIVTASGPAYHLYTSFVTSSGIGSNTFVVKMYSGNTAPASGQANAYVPNTTLQRVVTIADAGIVGSDTYGGYREWDVADATITLSNGQPSGFGNTVVYTWTITGNTDRPWRYASTGQVYPVEVIYQY
jgi:hypothetical protein